MLDADTTVRVTPVPGPQRSYDVVIRAGVVDELGTLAAAAAPAARYAVLAARSVAELYGPRILAALQGTGLDATLVAFDDGEALKTRETWAALTDQLLAAGFGRDCAVIAAGGGVTGDIAGFVAATYMRGVPVLQLPTTLLAMVDAAVGGKTGVDTPAGKNLVGAFHQPALVLMDPALLTSLPAEQLQAGLAEAIKHGAILDEQYFAWIEEHADQLLRADVALLTRLVARSVQLKARVTTDDPHEAGVRAILNFGHTIGHAIETASAYTLLHGFAVAIGMVAEAAAGEAGGSTVPGTADRLVAALRRCRLPVATRFARADGLMDLMRIDKKARSGVPRLTLLERIGSCAPAPGGTWTHAVAEDVLYHALERVNERVAGV